jgi:hypothetical protein
MSGGRHKQPNNTKVYIMANQQQQQYRRRQSQPATLLTRLPSIRRMEEVQNNQEEVDQEEEQLDGGYSGPSEPTEEEVEASNQQNEWGTDHVTRTGTPDRRFKENRALTEQDVGGGNYRRATVGRVVDGIHVTEDGAPDRRFKENRALTDEDIEIRKAELILAKHGILKPEISPTAILASHAPSNAPTQTRLVAQQPRQESPLARVARASSTRTKAAAQHKGPAKATANGSRRR